MSSGNGSYPVSPLETFSLISDVTVNASDSTSPIDLSIRRRSETNNFQREGVPFISPLRKGKTQKKLFFKDENEDSPLGFYSDLRNAQKNPNSALFDTPNEMSTMQSVTQMEKTKEDQSIIQNLGITQKTLIDCRYSLLFNEFAAVILEKTIVGLAPFDITFVLPSFPPNVHVVLQSFIADGVRQGICFPRTLRVFLNGVMIKSPGTYPLTLLDLTKCCPNATVRIFCAPEGRPFVLHAITTEYKEYSEIIENIKKTQCVEDLIDERTVNLVDPFIGKLLKTPSRGVNCQHSSCFELKTYVLMANLSHKWYCPICKKPLPIEELIVSRKTLKMVENATGKETRTEFEMNEPFIFDGESFAVYDDSFHEQEWYI